MTSSSGAPSGAAPRSGRGLLALALGATYLSRAVAGAAVESLRAELWLTDQALGTLASAFAGTFALALPIGAWLARGARRRVPLLAAGLAVCGIATALGALARGFWPLVAARCAAGAGAGFGAGATAGLLVALDRRGRGTNGLGAAVAGVALAYLAGGTAGWLWSVRGVFWVSGGAVVLAALLCLLAGDPPRRGPDPWPALGPAALVAAARRLLADRARALALGAAVVGTAALTALIFWLPALLVRARDVRRAWAGAELAALALASALAGAALARGALRPRGTPRPGSPAFAAAAGAGAAALALAVALYFGQPAVFLPALLAALVGAAAATFAALAAARERAAADPAALGLAILALHGLGELGGAFALGALADRVTFGRALYLLPGAFVVSGLLWAAAGWARESRARSGSAPDRELASP